MLECKVGDSYAVIMLSRIISMNNYKNVTISVISLLFKIEIAYLSLKQIYTT